MAKEPPRTGVKLEGGVEFSSFCKRAADENEEWLRLY